MPELKLNIDKKEIAVTYSILNNTSVLEYIKNRPLLVKLFPEGADLQAHEVGDGNLNLVFFAGSKDQTIVIKQAVPYLRVAGDSWPLTLERMRFETQALLLYNRLVPGLVPQVYDHDGEMSLVAMEYLGKHEIMRRPLVRRIRFPLFVDHISTFLAKTLFYTSDLFLSGPDKKQMQAQFINPQLCKIQEDFVFTNPYMESPENKWNPLVDAQVQEVRCNAPLKIAMGEMKESYMAHAQALIHSDLHTGSIMLNQEETRVIDPEFAFFGPIGYDVAAVLQNLVLNYLSHFAHTPDPIERRSYQIYLLDTIRSIWAEFARKFDDLWKNENKGELVPQKYWDFPGGTQAFEQYRQRYLRNVFRDMVGISGCKILRRMMGIVTVWDISSIEDLEKRATIERMAIRIGTRWLLEMDAIHSIEDYIGIVCEESGLRI
jgi:5-methylthioribose kinase